jgi:uncharacterized membrane protein YsdA (DUF1294 family)
MKDYLIFIIIYYILLSVYAAGLAVYDKNRALKRKRRVPENSMLWIGIFGGALAMFLTMKLIHHKTRVKKFMVYLPIIAFAHFGLFVFLAAMAINK